MSRVAHGWTCLRSSEFELTADHHVCQFEPGTDSAPADLCHQLDFFVLQCKSRLSFSLARKSKNQGLICTRRWDEVCQRYLLFVLLDQEGLFFCLLQGNVGSFARTPRGPTQDEKIKGRTLVV